SQWLAAGWRRTGVRGGGADPPHRAGAGRGRASLPGAAWLVAVAALALARGSAVRPRLPERARVHRPRPAGVPRRGAELAAGPWPGLPLLAARLLPAESHVPRAVSAAAPDRRRVGYAGRRGGPARAAGLAVRRGARRRDSYHGAPRAGAGALPARRGGAAAPAGPARLIRLHPRWPVRHAGAPAAIHRPGRGPVPTARARSRGPGSARRGAAGAGRAGQPVSVLRQPCRRAGGAPGALARAPPGPRSGAAGRHGAARRAPGAQVPRRWRGTQYA